MKQFKKISILLTLLFVAFGTVIAGDVNLEAWTRANQHYTAKQYDSALKYYQQIEQSGQWSTELYFNLGNTYFRLNDIGRSVLYFEKSLKLVPDNKQAKDNLALAKMRINKPVPVAEPVFFQRWWSGLLQAFGANGWAIVLLVLFCAVLVIAYLAARKKIAYSGRWMAASVSLFVVVLVIALFSFNAEYNNERAVVLQEQTPILDQPKAGGRISGNVSEGTTVHLIESQAGYEHIELPNGRRGWVLKASIEKI